MMPNHAPWMELNQPWRVVGRQPSVKLVFVLTSFQVKQENN